MSEINGIIVKAISGFYYVRSADRLYECKAVGSFRHSGITPVVGDRAAVSVLNEEKSLGSVTEILPRKNLLVRPPVANIDKLFLVSASVSPTPNTLLLDKLISIAESKDIEPVLVFNKSDLGDVSQIAETYKKAGFRVVVTCAAENSGTDELKALISGSVSAFTGNSGVGKSTILNCLFPQLELQTGDVSRKLGRGRHTTRHVELFCVGDDSYVLDTPGFSSLDFERCETILKGELQYTFRDFAKYLGNCRFSDCSHTKEQGCAVRAAVDNGEIAESRFESYLALYDIASRKNEWEL